MSEKKGVPPRTRERSQPDFRERVQAGFRRPKVSSAESQEMVAAGWHHIEWVAGEIDGIQMLESGHVEIFMWGYNSDMRKNEPIRRQDFRFRKPEDDFLAEARRAQSYGLTFEFGCYARYPLEPRGPFLVQQITYYAVWGPPHIWVDTNRTVAVEVKNKPLPVKVQ